MTPTEEALWRRYHKGEKTPETRAAWLTYQKERSARILAMTPHGVKQWNVGCRCQQCLDARKELLRLRRSMRVVLFQGRIRAWEHLTQDERIAYRKAKQKARYQETWVQRKIAREKHLTGNYT